MGGGRTQTKLMLNSTLVEVEVEVGVELGNKAKMFFVLNTSELTGLSVLLYLLKNS